MNDLNDPNNPNDPNDPNNPNDPNDLNDLIDPYGLFHLANKSKISMWHCHLGCLFTKPPKNLLHKTNYHLRFLYSFNFL